MEENKSNENTEEQLFKLYLAIDILDVMKKVNTEQALAKVEKRMFVRDMLWWEWTKRIAAVLFIPLLSLLFIQYMKMSQVPEVSEPQIISVSTTKGMTASLRLPDSTLVYLNSGSTLTYPSLFGNNIREVNLHGEAFFEVTKDAKRKFVVKASHNTGIQVYGTKFNLTAYPNENEVNATLVEGKVEFLYTGVHGQKRIMMRPGEELSLDVRNKLTKLKLVDVECNTSWKDGVLLFRDTPFPYVLRALSRRFNVTFVIKRPELQKYTFNGSFEDQSFSRILEYLEVSSKLKFRPLKDEGIIEVY